MDEEDEDEDGDAGDEGWEMRDMRFRKDFFARTKAGDCVRTGASIGLCFLGVGERKK